jgi:hypothetical protein
VTWSFLPGTFTPDSLTVCGEAFTGSISDWHTPTLAWLWSLVDLRPGVLLLGVVTTFVAAVYAVLATRLRAWVAVAGTYVVVLSPTTLGLLGVHGKDEWFAAAFLASLALLVTAGRQRSRRVTVLLVVAGLVMAWVAVAARKNAVLPVGGMLLVGFPWDAVGPWRPVRWWTRALLRVALTGGFLMVVLLSQLVLSSMVIHPREGFVEQATYQFDLAGMSVRTGEDLFPDGALREGTTVEDIDAFFDPRAGDGWYFAEGTPLVYPVGAAEVEELRRAWLRAIREHPFAYLGVRLEYTWALVGLSQPHPGGALWAPDQDGAAWGIACPDGERDNPEVNDAIVEVLQRVERTEVVRGWLLMVVLVGAAFIADIRRPEVAGLVSGGLLNEVTFAIGGISPTFRYSWFTGVCALIVCGLALSRWSRAARRPDSTSEDLFTTLSDVPASTSGGS